MKKNNRAKMLCAIVLMTVVCLLSTAGQAGTGWIVPSNKTTNSDQNGNNTFSYSTQARLTDDLATRSGPSTSYTGCGSYKMKGQTVTVLSRSYDDGGVLWVEVEFSYGGGYRRAWTGAKRLDLSSTQIKNLPEEDLINYIGYGTINTRTVPRFGPGNFYSTYGDRDLKRRDRVVVIDEVDDYYKIECYYSNGEVFRSWVPTENVTLD